MKPRTLLALPFLVFSTHELHAGYGAEVDEITGPVDYVRVCDAFGSGFFYIPGSETCVKIGSHLKADLNGGPAYAFGTTLGYNTNPAEEISNAEESSFFIRPTLAAAVIGGTEDAYYYFGGVYSATFYQDMVINRDQDDQTVHDLSLRAGLRIKPSPGFGFWSDNTLEYAGHLGQRFGANRLGLSQDQVFRYQTENEVIFRLDGQDLGSTGWLGRIRVSWLGYEGEDRDTFDFGRFSVVGGARYHYTERNSVGFFGGCAEKCWDTWSVFDSQSLFGGVELEGDLDILGGARYDFRAGFENRDYDDGLIDDKDSQPFARFAIGAKPTPDLYVGWETYYGISDAYNNFGGAAFADAKVFRNEIQVRYTFGGWTALGSINQQWLDPHVQNTAQSEIERWNFSVGLETSLQCGWDLGASVGYTTGEYGFGGNDDFDATMVSIQTSRSF